MDYNLSYNVAAFFIFLVILIIDAYKKKTSLMQNKIFTWIVCVSAIGVTISTIGTLFDLDPGVIPNNVKLPLHYLHFLFIGILPFMYTIYCLALAEIKLSNMSWTLRLFILVPQLLEVLFILSNAFNHSLFYYDQTDIYQRGNLQPVFYLLLFYYGIFGPIIVSCHKEAVNRKLRFALYGYFVVGCMTALLQFAVPYLIVQYFGMAICELMVSFLIQTPEEYLDNTLGVFNKRAFSRILSLNQKNGKDMQVLLVCIEDLKLLNQAVGSARMNLYMQQIADFLDTLTDKKTYILTSSTFGLIIESSDHKALEPTIENIKKRFSDKWVLEHSSMNLVARMMEISIPEDTTDLDTILFCCSYLRKVINMPDSVLKATDISLSGAGRQLEVEKKIKEAIQKDGFDMYYQPIYSVKAQKIKSAEALIRLYDKDMGFIPPDEFIPIAEKNGSIIKVGEQIFTQVFSFMRENSLIKKDISYIEINLSVVQCMQESFAEHVLDMMKEYGICENCINLEITETAAASLPKQLLQNMLVLDENMVHFSLDDFGTGYSNFSSIMALPLELIKFDKTLVDMATESEKGRSILNSLVVMVKNMNVKIVAEGVETIEQKEMLEQMGVDYLQGYYFSRPLPGKEFLKYIEKFNHEKQENME